VARPFIQETISETPPTLDTLTRTAPRIRSFLGHSATLFADLRPGIKSLSENSPAIASALETGADVLPGVPRLNAQLAPTTKTLEAFATDQGVKGGVRRSTQLFGFLTPAVRFLAPAQTFCNYPSLLFRNAADLLSIGDGVGTWQRFTVNSVLPPGIGENSSNSENSPSSGPGNGPVSGAAQYFLHANPYPYTAAPGQPRVCESGNEKYKPNQIVIGHPGVTQARTEQTGG
jgi:hypothetical protein